MDFDAAGFLAGAQVTFNLTKGSATFRPTFALDWRETDFDTYTETEVPLSSGLTAPFDSGLALVFYDDKRTSLQSTIGIDASVTIGKCSSRMSESRRAGASTRVCSAPAFARSSRPSR